MKNRVVKRDSMIHIPVSLIANPEKIKNALTVKNPEYIAAKRFSKFKVKLPEYLYFYKYNKPTKIVSLPRNFPLDSLSKLNYTLEEKISEGRSIDSFYNDVDLRPSQQFAYSKIKELQTEGDTDFLISLKTGRGKSLLSLILAAELGRSILVVCLTNSLIDQWLTLIKEVHPKLGFRIFPNWKAGKYVEGKDNDFDVTFATYSQLGGTKKSRFKRAFPSSFYKDYGTIIFDEWHRSGAESFNLINEKATCKHRFTLTATFRRSDGLEDVLQHHIQRILEDPVPVTPMNVIAYPSKAKFSKKSLVAFSDKAVPFRLIKPFNTVAIYKRTNSKQPYIITTIQNSAEMTDDDGNKIGVRALYGKDGTIYPNNEFVARLEEPLNLSGIDTLIASNPLIIWELAKIVKLCVDAGRTPLLLSRRTRTIYALYKRLEKIGVKGVGVYLSAKRKDYGTFCKNLGVKPTEHQKFCVTEASVILGIEKLANEGLDISSADTLIIAHPMRDIEQPCGRIDRGYTNSKPPLTIFMRYDIPAYEGLFYSRTGAKYWFEQLGHTIYNTTNLIKYL